MTKAEEREELEDLREELSELTWEEYIDLGWYQDWWLAAREVAPYCHIPGAKRPID